MFISFPKDFLWGAATSAYQIEGGANEDGRGESVWDVLVRQPGKIKNGDTGDLACDSYHRYAEDVEMLKRMNLTSYRFSVSWPRIFPDGTGRMNQKGVDYYRRLIDLLLKEGIRPNITLYSWDLPQKLEERGGWTNRDSAKWFGEYAYAMFDSFRDTGALWTTVNEPIESYLAYTKGGFAPDRFEGEKVGKQVQHNMMLAHGEGVSAFRAVAPKNAEVGIVVDCWKYHPLRQVKEDIELARREEENACRMFLNPLFLGDYSPYIWEQMRRENTVPEIKPEDFALISQPIDFYGLNIYSRHVVCADPQVEQHAKHIQAVREFYPECVDEVLDMLLNEFHVKIPIYITENGVFDKENMPRDEHGVLQDDHRIAYMKEFLKRFAHYIEKGVDIRGYYHWSLLDNLEWVLGYSVKMGLVECGPDCLQRRMKKSAFWYADTAKNHGFEEK